MILGRILQWSMCPGQQCTCCESNQQTQYLYLQNTVPTGKKKINLQTEMKLLRISIIIQFELNYLAIPSGIHQGTTHIICVDKHASNPLPSIETQFDISQD